jgi:hypothetical protein
MANSYVRRCRNCDRSISMRQMPYGQWVAFEGDAVHQCNKPPQRPPRPLRPRPMPPSTLPGAEGDSGFDDFEIRVPTPPNPHPLPRTSPDRQDFPKTATQVHPGEPPLETPQAPPPQPVIGNVAPRQPPPSLGMRTPSGAATANRDPPPRPSPDNHEPAKTARRVIPDKPPLDVPRAPPRTVINDIGPKSSPPSREMRAPPRAASVEPTMPSWQMVLCTIAAIYIGIGAIHSIYFNWFISRADCISPKNTIVYIFCNTGMGISHFVAVLGWPFYYR